jgi:hypothetical protein
MHEEGVISTGEPDEHQGLLPLLQAASIQGRIAHGPDAGRHLERLGRSPTAPERFVPRSLCAELDGFSLHAGVRIASHERGRLEHLCRYVARPPLATSRLTLSRHGRVLWELRRPWRDGTTHMVFEPLVFLERLAALVPPPRQPQKTYHGVLAPAASWRDEIVPPRPSPPSSDTGRKEQATPPRPPHRYLWAELMRRVFALDVLRCPFCNAPRRLVSLITRRDVIVRILAHLRLDTDPPPLQPARAPPQLELPF